MRSLPCLALAALFLCACAGEAARPPHGKPEAPVAVRVDSVDLGGQRFEVRVTATPRLEVHSLELSLRLPAGARSEEGDAPVVFGATAAGRSRSLVRHVNLSVPGVDVVGDARVGVGNGTRNRAHVVRLGAAKPAEAPARTQEIVLPSGERVEEVRP